jgi:hypothetical protein
VKDPSSLLRQVNGIHDEGVDKENISQSTQIIEELEAKNQSYKKREKQAREELKVEMDRRVRAE